jgi:cyclic pyranopterin phosphate synthase
MDRPLDAYRRRLHDLRISVTDRCNFRCVYCMPKEVYGRDYAFLPRSMVLTFEEIARLARLFVDLGVEKLRITGGEPLVRRDLPDLIGLLAGSAGRTDAARPHPHDEQGRPANARPATSDAASSGSRSASTPR